MKKFIAMAIFASGFFSTPVFASNFSNCYAQAQKSMSSHDAVLTCAGSRAGFSNCYAQAQGLMSSHDAVITCSKAESEFSDCFSQAQSSMSKHDAVITCVPKTCN